MTTAFVSATPILSRATTPTSLSSFTCRRVAAVTPARRHSTISMSIDEKPQKIPQGFTAFSEQLNGRAAMVGFALAVVTEVLTGQGVIGQVASLFDISNIASALGH